MINRKSLESLDSTAFYRRKIIKITQDRLRIAEIRDSQFKITEKKKEFERKYAQVLDNFNNEQAV